MTSHYPYADVKERDLYPDHWCRFEKREGGSSVFWKCSCCGSTLGDVFYHKLKKDGILGFCPTCGAKVIDDE